MSCWRTHLPRTIPSRQRHAWSCPRCRCTKCRLWHSHSQKSIRGTSRATIPCIRHAGSRSAHHRSLRLYAQTKTFSELYAVFSVHSEFFSARSTAFSAHSALLRTFGQSLRTFRCTLPNVGVLCQPNSHLERTNLSNVKKRFTIPVLF